MLGVAIFTETELQQRPSYVLIIARQEIKTVVPNSLYI